MDVRLDPVHANVPGGLGAPQVRGSVTRSTDDGARGLWHPPCPLVDDSFLEDADGVEHDNSRCRADERSN